MPKKWNPNDHERNVGLQMLAKLKNEAPRRFTSPELASEFYLNIRTVRNLLHWLEEDQEAPIISSSDKKGYCYATGEMISEMLQSRNERISRAAEILAGNHGVDKMLRSLGVPIEDVKIQIGNFKI